MVKNNFSKLPIIMLSMSRWDGQFSSASISLAKEFSKNTRVFYVDNPFTIKDFISSYKSNSIQSRVKALLFGRDIFKPIESSNLNLIAVTPRLVLPINWLDQGSFYEYFSRINNKVIIEIIKKIKTEYKFEDYILFNSFNPFYGQDIPAGLKPVFTVYQSRDDISESDYVSKHGVKKEIAAINNAHFSMATSLGLVKKLTHTSKREIKYLPNAADISLFKRSSEVEKKPAELEGVNKKVIGYTGNICHRINYDLLKKIALAHTDKIILLVGPVNNSQFFEKGIDSLPNVITTGAKSIELLPEYLKFIDCAIIPFHCNELTKSIYPLKINEYLAAGKAVVSTNFSEDISGFNEVVYLAENDEQFISSISTAISNNTQEKIDKRKLKAESNSWEARVKLFWEFVNIYV